MSNQLSKYPDFIKFQFSQEWIDVGILTLNNFTSLKQEYLKGEDKRTEHYRYGAFRAFIQANKIISSKNFYTLYKIGKNDPDYSMGRAIIFDIIKHPCCPEETIELAAKDKDLTLSKYALKYQFIRKAEQI